MLNFFAPRAFVIEERHETADTADLVLDRLESKSVLSIGGAFTSASYALRRGDQYRIAGE